VPALPAPVVPQFPHRQGLRLTSPGPAQSVFNVLLQVLDDGRLTGEWEGQRALSMVVGSGVEFSR
jgi:hypothetical protein